MTFEIALLLSLIVLAVVLFALDWIQADVVSLGLLLSLVLTGLLPAQKAFAGFGSDVVILILGLLILTAIIDRQSDLSNRGSGLQVLELHVSR